MTTKNSNKSKSSDKSDQSLDAVLLFDPNRDQHQYQDDVSEAQIVRSNRIIWFFGLLLVVLIAWAYFAELTEVSSGTGKIIPNSREQVIQSLEGGIISHLYVREGDIVEPQQILAQLDLTKTEANVGESAAKHRAAVASVARLEAEVNGTKLSFPESLNEFPSLIQAETRLYNTRQAGLNESITGLRQSLGIVSEELRLTQSLAKAGAASHVDVLKLQRQVSEIRLKITERQAEYMVKAREELARAKAEADSLEEVIRGRSDSLSRLTLRSPVRGVVKDIEVTTQGGVIPPNGRLMVIVPMEDQLLVEARISPRDIAFIRPGLEAKVKVTAYDYSIYGALNGEVVTVSPDTIQDEIKPEVFYYRAFIRTSEDALINEETGMRYPIVPGMIATVDIKTGEKTVFEYLMKPINRAQEAMRER
ncbi:secretion protein HlyD [Alcaligenes faecalis]|uniref:HlyD family type I secretion periplasmic adaptor subunit n=1 Tax=Alcaligenes faecalis TaxID=511 RepID=UPI000A2E5112|nr:HlyD family type I secretion periplasmic adaptor subunit [Alcaligenes faecalis]KAA1284955.1 HlyD family type I secretion periplasmic adaptor subunit [Alcaligenes faecalis]OSZ37087.1 secretion protein HlyD [Alcaligenes faecalis]OSZ40530.1 secretion protein HlyD [Alcaligenes faecalis]